MPKIDPNTGCSVMTQSEFWRSEAEAEGQGRSGSDLADEFYSTLREQEQEDERRLLEPSEALATLKRYDEADEEGRIGGGIDALVRVVSTGCRIGLNSSSASIVAEVRCKDGHVRKVRWSSSSYGGSWMTPPEYEETMEEVL